VWVRRSDWDRVTEREEFVGRLRAVSRLPQYLNGEVSGVEEFNSRGPYLMTAMFTGAVVLALYTFWSDIFAAIWLVKGSNLEGLLLLTFR
jgi:hypothetical protein